MPNKIFKEEEKMKTAKKVISVILSVVAVICILGGIFYSVDRKRIGDNEDPVFAVKVYTLKDGGTKEYYGLGYKIIKYNKMGENGDIEKDDWEIGSFLLEYK